MIQITEGIQRYFPHQYGLSVLNHTRFVLICRKRKRKYFETNLQLVMFWQLKIAHVMTETNIHNLYRFFACSMKFNIVERFFTVIKEQWMTYNHFSTDT